VLHSKGGVCCEDSGESPLFSSGSGFLGLLGFWTGGSSLRFLKNIQLDTYNDNIGQIPILLLYLGSVRGIREMIKISSICINGSNRFAYVNRGAGRSRCRTYIYERDAGRVHAYTYSKRGHKYLQ